MEILIRPIGVVRADLSDDEIRNSSNGYKGYIEIFEHYLDGLYGIEEFSHLIIIAYLHKVPRERRKVLKVKPRKWLRFGIDLSDIPEVGVFCTDSPHRPNPIAITIVRLIGRQDNKLFVDGLDLFDGTPILDIKPYTPARVISDIKLPDWYIELSRRIKDKLGVNSEI